MTLLSCYVIFLYNTTIEVLYSDSTFSTPC